MKELWKPDPNRTYKTHCAKGHEYTPENTLIHQRGRFCKKCMNEGQRRRSRLAYGKGA